MKNASSIINNEPRYSDGDIYYYHGDHLGSATWITDATGAPVQYIQYLPTGEIWQNITAGNYNERFKFTGKEHDEESGYDYFGARYYWSLGGIWTAIDPLADKYPSNNPYMYCSGNPLKNIDMHGDSVSFAQVELFDKTYGTNAMENTISDLQSITGLSLSANNGMLEYAKNEDGSAQLSSNGSSATAREQLIALISNNQTINVGIGRKSGTLGNEISLSPKQINSFISGARGVDRRTLGFGMTFLHESFHTDMGGGLTDDLNGRGSVVDKMNVIRMELNNVGYNFGQRMSYYAVPSHGNNYIPFNNSALQALGAGLLPCFLFRQQYIRF